jgi:hypothetical protein
MKRATKLKASIAAFAMAFSLLTMSALQAAQPAAAASSCEPTMLIGVHGTGEETGVIGQELSALYNDVKGHTGLPEQGLTSWHDDSTLFADLASGFAAGDIQPAMATLILAVDAGAKDLNTEVSTDEGNCPKEHFIIAGFSQGAMVVHQWMNQYVPNGDANVSGVILWADPTFDGSDPTSYGAIDGTSTFTSSSGWIGAFSWNASFPDPIPSAWSGKTDSYCISDDPICNMQDNFAADGQELLAGNHGHENLTPAITTASDSLVDSEGVGWAPSVYDDSAATFYTTWQANGGVSGWLGQPSSDVVNKPGGGLLQSFAGSDCGSGSAILWSASTGTHAMGGCIYNAFLSKYGGPGGTYGYPTTDQDSTPNGTGVVNYMSGSACSSTESGSGLFYSAATGTWPVMGCIFQKYKSIGEDKSGIGLPTSGENVVSGGHEQNFSNGSITDANGSITVTIKSSGGSALDNTDPYTSGCVTSSYPKSTVLQTTDGPTVIDLEWSAHCGTNWTQVTPNTGTGDGAIEMVIFVERKNSNGTVTVGDEFEFPPNGSTIAWSNQLYAPTEPARACEEYWVRATKTWSTTVCTAWSAAT